jgi:hypothetical protein
MKRMLKAPAHLVLALGLVALALAAPASAQTGRDSRVISAKAGGVNLVAGGAEFRRANEKVWLPLSTKDDLTKGDVVRTAAGGRVELLLNPGSYWRADGSTEFALMSTALDDLSLRLERGSAVIEATGFGDFAVALVVVTPQTRIRIARAGVYRFNVLPTGETVLVVEKGRAYLGEGSGPAIKGGKVVRVGAGGAAPEVTKFDKKTRDEFDQWSRLRGRELAKANERLSTRQTNTLLASLDVDSYFTGTRPSAGFWYWNPGTNCYTFLSFYPGWRSPYGFGYRSWFFTPYNFNCYSCPSAGVYRGGYVNMPAPTNTGGGYPGGNPGGTQTGGVRPDGNSPSAAPTPTIVQPPMPTPRIERSFPIQRDGGAMPVQRGDQR